MPSQPPWIGANLLQRVSFQLWGCLSVAHFGDYVSQGLHIDLSRGMLRVLCRAGVVDIGLNGAPVDD